MDSGRSIAYGETQPLYTIRLESVGDEEEAVHHLIEMWLELA